jgi:L-asparaginase / beta-aspartyl-peptidase
LSSGGNRFSLAIHGGSGVRVRQEMTAELERDYRDALRQSLAAGFDVLKAGGPSVDAVEAAIRVMEDSPLFNAGKGAAFTSSGTNELDAAIMDGSTLMAGGVAGVKRIRNPIRLARLVMERSPHVLMIGDGAEAFAQAQGVDLVPAGYFHTDRQWQKLQAWIARKIPYGEDLSPAVPDIDLQHEDSSHGTVGAVAMDRAGHLAAGTSTGGRVYKHPGRVGDSPIIGAGTYASNDSCAVSTTGLGEFHMRLLSAREVAVLLTYRGMSVQEALDEVIRKKLVQLGGGGGAVAIDRQGNVGMSFSGNGMYRGQVGTDGRFRVAVYED